MTKLSILEKFTIRLNRRLFNGKIQGKVQIFLKEKEKYYYKYFDIKTHIDEASRTAGLNSLIDQTPQALAKSIVEAI